MSIQRLDPDTNMSGLPLMVPADDGGYVDYDDHVAEVERLRAEAVERERVWAEHVARREFASADNERATVKWAKRNAHELAAEVERLREALLRIIERYDDADAGTYDRPLDNAIEAARAALAGEGTEPAPQGSVEDITQAIAGRNKQ